MASVDPSNDFANTDINGHAYGVILASIICPAVAALFVIGRLVVRSRITKNMRIDDYLAVLTLLSNIAYSVLQGLGAQRYIGIGQQQSKFPDTEESPYYEWVYMFDTLYIVSLLGFKTTILMLYMRVFGVRKHFKWACWFWMFVIVGYLVGSLIAQVAGCSPPHKFWDMYIPGSCIDYKRFDIAYGCLNVITDFALGILPLREIWRLYIPIKEKFWASLIFGSALIAFGTSLVSQIFRFHDLFSVDRTWDAGVTFVWQTIEINTGLICSCTPILRPLYRKTVDRLTATFTSSRDEQQLRTNVQRELDGKQLDDITSDESSPPPRRDFRDDKDLERGRGVIGHVVGRNRPIPSDIYMSPLPSSEAEKQAREAGFGRPAPELESEPHVSHTAWAVSADAPPVPPKDDPSDDRGRASKRYSQVELEAMVRQASYAQERLEAQAERSRQRYELDEETHSERTGHASVGTFPPLPGATGAASEGLEGGLQRGGSRKAKKKKSCDLEKGIGLRI